MARRDKCAKLFSDNGKNFVGASNEIKKLLEIVRNPDEKLANYLAAEGIDKSLNSLEEPNLTKFCTTFGTAIREDSHFLLTSNRSALFHTTGSTTTERPSIKTDSPLLYEMTSLLRTSASPPMSPHQSSCSNHTAKESKAPREPQRTLKTLYYFTQDSKRTHD
ncbi:hypothetical protein TNCV_5043491 [Trichonephila clavipes]|uniref:Uncharacterized protein n=1 Tax=Trichonephila clavipes TaxID=2585209 RepID=A0A8X6R418_TRICX|nr:hypothetical protein TNCV_5043491 [Trichonephila clavipes]